MNSSTQDSVPDQLATLVGGRNRDPFAVLGPHPDDTGHLVVRAFYPAAHAIDLRIVATGELRPMTKRDAAGVFEVAVDDPYCKGGEAPDYRLRISLPGDQVSEVDDPYRYGRVLSDFDLHLLCEG